MNDKIDTPEKESRPRPLSKNEFSKILLTLNYPQLSKLINFASSNYDTFLAHLGSEETDSKKIFNQKVVPALKKIQEKLEELDEESKKKALASTPQKIRELLETSDF